MEKLVTKEHESGFKFKKLFLSNSSFNKGVLRDSSNLNMRIERSYKKSSTNDLEFNIKVTVFLNSKKDKRFKFSASMVGIFLIEGTPSLNWREFATINGPAIIYPYLREHFRWTSLHADISPPILLPILNFQTLGKEDSSLSKENKS